MFKLYRDLLERKKAAESSESGFTLIELLIVIIVLGILAAIVIFSLTGVTGQSQVAACNSDAKTVETATAAYQAATGSWPSTISQLTNATATPDSPFLKTAPSATVASNGYSIPNGLGSNGAVNVSTSTANPNGSTYDVSGTVANPCAAA